MKKSFLFLMMFISLLSFGADEVKNHITGQFELLKAGKNFTSNKDGIVTFSLNQKINSGGARELIVLNQTKPVPIEFGAESKLDRDLEGGAGAAYSVYADIIYTDKTVTYHVILPFSTKAHDWELKKRVFVPRKPIAKVSYYLLFRNRPAGIAQFRNPFLREIPQPKKITISGAVDKADALYKIGETAVFSFDITEGDKPLKKGKITLNLTYDGRKVIEKKEFDLAQSQKISLSGKLDKPGFLRCDADITIGGKRYSKTLRAGFDVNNITLGIKEPADFDKFWQNALAQTAAMPLDLKIEQLPEYSKGLTNTYKLSVAAPEKRIYGFLRVPKAKGKYPLIVTVPGAGPGVDRPPAKEYAKAATLIANIHGYDPMQPGKKIIDLYREVTRRGHYAWRGYGTPQQSYFYPAILGINRMIDYVISREDIDENRLGYDGISQGGGFGFILCGIVPNRFKTAVFNVPALCDLNGFRLGRNSGWPLYNEKMGSRANMNSRYYDAGYFAARIGADTEIVVIVGLSDNVCCASSIYAAYNQLKVKNKKIINEIGMGHEQRGNYYAAISAMLKKLQK